MSYKVSLVVLSGRLIPLDWSAITKTPKPIISQRRFLVRESAAVPASSGPLIAVSYPMAHGPLGLSELLEAQLSRTDQSTARSSMTTRRLTKLPKPLASICLSCSHTSALKQYQHSPNFSKVVRVITWTMRPYR